MKKYPDYIVPLNIAKELKIIGFKSKVYFYYINDKEYRGLYTARKPEDFNKNTTISIPVWEQVFLWFRNKGYDVNISYVFHPKLKCCVGYMYEIIYNYERIKSDNYFNSYEAARKICLEELIKTYKNEQFN